MCDRSVLCSKSGWLISKKAPFSEAKAFLDAEHFSLASLQDSELLHGSNEGQCCGNPSGVHKTPAAASVSLCKTPSNPKPVFLHSRLSDFL